MCTRPPSMHPALSGQRELSQAKAPIGPYQPSERRPLGARYGGPKRLYQPQSEWEGGGHSNLKGYCQILDFSHGQASSVHKTLTLCLKNLPLETYDTFSRRIDQQCVGGAKRIHKRKSTCLPAWLKLERWTRGERYTGQREPFVPRHNRFRELDWCRRRGGFQLARRAGRVCRDGR